MSWNSKRKSGFVEYYDSILFVLVLAIWALIGRQQERENY